MNIESLAYLKSADKVEAALRNMGAPVPPRRAIEKRLHEIHSTPPGWMRPIGEPSEDDGVEFAPRAKAHRYTVSNHIFVSETPDISDEIAAVKRAADRLEQKIDDEAERRRAIKVRRELRAASRRLPFSQRLIFDVCDELDLDRAKVLGMSRKKPYVHARALVAILLREKDEVRYSYPQVARLVGRTDHSTAIHWVRNFLDIYCKQDARLYDLYKALGGKL